MPDHDSRTYGLRDALDRAAELISPGDLAVTPVAELDRTPLGGMCQSLVDVGWFAVRQFEVMLAFTETQAEALTLIPDLIDRANSYGSASPAAVGAAASLVDLVRSDDVFEIIQTINTARKVIGDPDLAAGVAAFLAALTEQIGRITAIDPVVVHAELCRGMSPPDRAAASHVAHRVTSRVDCTRSARLAGASRTP